jgi:glycerophosphoryl diester phosphodiesterase
MTPHHHSFAAAAAVLVVIIVGCVVAAQSTRKILVAHRGASAYAPEHTLAAYRLALEQGADFVEQDLQISKDGVLVCLHDLTLERTTDVEEIFPDRAAVDANGRKTWQVSDFTVEELKRLDAGSWFKPVAAAADVPGRSGGPGRSQRATPEFKHERIPTFQEAIDLVKGKAGLYPETKGPEIYGSRGFDMEALVLTQLAKNRLDGPGAAPATPVIIQSFSPDSLRKMKKAGTTLPLVLLVSDLDPLGGRWLTDEGLKEARQFAAGLGPAKALVLADPTLVTRAHAAGLTVTPYTFRSAGMAAGKTVKEEMADFLYRIGVDALFTDNPDQFPRR